MRNRRKHGWPCFTLIRTISAPRSSKVRTELNGQTSFNDLDTDSLLRIAVFLPEIKDLVALRSVCRASWAASSAASWRYLVAARCGLNLVAPPGADRRKELEHAMGAYRGCMSLRVAGGSITGAWTCECTAAGYYIRISMPGAVSKQVLLLDRDGWVELNIYFQDVLPGEYVLSMRHINDKKSFPVRVTDNGVTLKDLDIPCTIPADARDRRWTLQNPYSWNRQGGVASHWERLELGRVVVVAGAQRSCHVKLVSTLGTAADDVYMYTSLWALDCVELKRVMHSTTQPLAV